MSPLQEKLLAELTPELNDRVQYAEVSCVEEKNGKYRFLAKFFWNILDSFSFPRAFWESEDLQDVNPLRLL